MYASFHIHDKRQTRSRKILMLMISRSSPKKWNISLEEPDDDYQLAPSAMHKIQTHLNFASQLFSSSHSSTPSVMMALLGAPSLWEQSNLECERKPTKPTLSEKHQVDIDIDLLETILRDWDYDSRLILAEI